MFHYHANYVSPPFQDPLSRSVTYGTQYCAPKIYVATKFCSRTTIVRAEPSDDNNYCSQWSTEYFSVCSLVGGNSSFGVGGGFFLIFPGLYQKCHGAFHRLYQTTWPGEFNGCCFLSWVCLGSELLTWHLVWQCLELHKVIWSCCPFFDFGKSQ